MSDPDIIQQSWREIKNSTHLSKKTARRVTLHEMNVNGVKGLLEVDAQIILNILFAQTKYAAV
jgi:hypothetical protein